MTTSTQDDGLLRETVTGLLNTHDLAGVMDHGAPATEYDPEMKDLVGHMAGGTPVTAEVVATVWHKWFGDPSESPSEATIGMKAMAASLQAVQRDFGKMQQLLGGCPQPKNEPTISSKTLHRR